MASRARDLAQRANDVEALPEAYRTLVGVAIERRDTPEARALLAQAWEARPLPPDAAWLDYLEGFVALRVGAHARAGALLEEAAARLVATAHPHGAARAYLLLAECRAQQGRVVQTADALNRLAPIVGEGGYVRYLGPVARFARKVLLERPGGGRLRAATIDLLGALSGETGLRVVGARGAAERRGAAVVGRQARG